MLNSWTGLDRRTRWRRYRDLLLGTVDASVVTAPKWLLAWVQGYVRRYPNGVRIPDCWWQHSDFVEALSALRDYERASFGRRSPAIAAVEWQRARRDIEQSLEVWGRRLPCAVPGGGHRTDAPLAAIPPGWDAHVSADVARCRAAAPKFPDADPS